MHVQKSVFEGSIEEKKLLNLQKELESVINPKKDQVAIYELDSYRYTSKHLIGYYMSQDNII